MMSLARDDTTDASTSHRSVTGGSMVRPGSRLHWALLAVGAAGSVVFTATYLLDGWLRAGYDSWQEPESALSLGGLGWIQIVNFVTFGLTTIISAAGWQATLAGGRGAVWYPRLRVLSGLALIAAGAFSQDPDVNFPVNSAVPAHPSGHAVIHTLAAFVSLIAIVTELLVLARRLHVEAAWRGWATAAAMTAVTMMASLAAFGTLTGTAHTGGGFEKLASIMPSLFSLTLITRLARRHDPQL